MSTALKLLLNYGQTPPKSLTSFAFFITMDLIISLPVTQGLILQGLKIKCKYWVLPFSLHVVRLIAQEFCYLCIYLKLIPSPLISL